MDKKLHVRLNVDKYIREELNMSIRSDIYPILNEKIKQILIEAKSRAKRDRTKSIMGRHI